MSSCHGHVGKAGWVVVGKAGNRSAGRLLARGVPFLRDCAPTRGVSVQSPGSAVTFLAGFCCCCCCRCRSLLSSVLGGSEAAFAGLLEALLLLFRLRLQFLLLHSFPPTTPPTAPPLRWPSALRRMSSVAPSSLSASCPAPPLMVAPHPASLHFPQYVVPFQPLSLLSPFAPPPVPPAAPPRPPP